MSDDTDIHSESLEQTAAPQGGIKGFLSTTVGKVVVGCLAASILLAIVAVVLMIALGAFGINKLGNAVDQASTTGASSTTTGTPSSSGTRTVQPSASLVPTPAVLTVTDEDVFTPRDPFIPVVLPAPPAPAGTVTGMNSSSSGVTISLINKDVQSITTADSNLLYYVGGLGTDTGSWAELDYKGVVYNVAPGGVIPNSPWKLLSIGTEGLTITMLFGDERVTVAIGQGVQSK